MFRSTRSQIVLILSVFCISLVTGFVFMRKSNQEKMSMLVAEMHSEKAVLLDRIIDFESKSLLDYTFDYTYWDEMVAFVKSFDAQWARENIESSITTYNVDYVWVYNPNLSLIYNVSDSNVPAINKLPFDDASLGKIVKSGKFQHFFFQAGQEIIEISGASIHPTTDKERKTPVRGYYFAGRLWSGAYLNEIGLLTGSSIRLVKWNEGGKSTNELPEKIFEFSNTKVLNGWDNLPVAQVTSTSNIENIEQLSSRIDRRFVFGTIFSAFFIIIFLAFFWLRVYKPLGLLSKSLENGDSVAINGLLYQKNEFGQLSVLINNFFQQKDKLIEEISERKLVEKQLLKLSTATEQSPATIMITSINGNIEYVNPKFTEVTGYSSKEVIGKNPRFLNSGNKSVDDYRVLWETIKSGSEWHGEFSNKKKSGEIFHELAVISPLTDETGNIINFLAVKEDITDRKRDEKIRKILFGISKAGAISKNLDDLIDQIKEQLGEIIDVTNFYLAIYDPLTDSFSLPRFQDQKDDIETFQAAKTLTAYVLRTKKTFFGTEDMIAQLKKEGVVESLGEPAKIWLGVPLMIDDRAFGVFVVQSYDNEQAFSEKDKEMLEFISNEISHVILRKKADEEVRTALDKAEGSDRLKSAFLANMGHEIRTPLNSILGFTELLNDPEISPSYQGEFTQIIKSSGKQLLTTINDILDFSMIEAGQVKLFKTTFVIEKVILDISNEFRPLAIEKGIEYKVPPTNSKTETFIECDHSRLKQVLSNLVSNAIKFTRTGSVELGCSNGFRGFLFYVKDTGIGISPEFKDHVFERFHQAEKTKSRNYGGNGLGLAISRNLVEMMGGKIWYESRAGKGSMFYVFIPK